MMDNKGSKIRTHWLINYYLLLWIEVCATKKENVCDMEKYLVYYSFRLNLVVTIIKSNC